MLRLHCMHQHQTELMIWFLFFEFCNFSLPQDLDTTQTIRIRLFSYHFQKIKSKWKSSWNFIACLTGTFWWLVNLRTLNVTWHWMSLMHLANCFICSLIRIHGQVRIRKFIYLGKLIHWFAYFKNNFEKTFRQIFNDYSFFMWNRSYASLMKNTYSTNSLTDVIKNIFFCIFFHEFKSKSIFM